MADNTVPSYISSTGFGQDAPASNDGGAYAAFVKAAGYDPDAEAKARQAARVAQVPVSSARNQPQSAQQQVAIAQQQQKAQAIAQAPPATQSWFSKLSNAIVGKDDTEILGTLGTLLGVNPTVAQALGAPVTHFGEQAGVDLANNPKGVLRDIRPTNLAKSAAAGVGNLGVGSYTGAESFLGDTAPGLLGGLVQKAQQQRQAWTQYRNANLSPDAQTFTGKAVNAGVEGLPTVTAALVGSAIGGPEVGAGVLGGSSFLSSYGQARDEGAGPNRALLYGGINGAINAAVGKFMGGQASDAIAASAANDATGNNVGEFFKNFLTSKFVTQDVGLNQLAAAGQSFNQWATLDANKGKSFSDWLSEQPADQAQALIGTMTMLAAMHGTGVAARMFDRLAGRAQVRGQQMQSAEQVHQTLQDMSTLSAASKLRERDPLGFHDFVSQASQDGPIDSVYVHPDQLLGALHQSSQPAAEGEENGQALPSPSKDVLAQLAEQAKAQGVDVRIPVADYETHIAGSSVDKALLDHLKVDPDGMSRAEAGEWLNQNGGRVAQELSDALLKVKEDNSWNQSVQNVHDDIKAQLDRANPAGARTNFNDSNAAMMSNFFGTMAGRLGDGRTPEDLYRQFGPRITGANSEATENASGADGRLDQAGAGGSGIERRGADGEPEGRGTNPAEGSPLSDRGQPERERLGHEGEEGPRGAYSPAENVIALFKSANLSTFQHESAHFYLAALNWLHLEEGAPEPIKSDFNQIMDWFGIKGGAGEWNRMSLEEQRPYHEQFARGFESYLFSGKAPSLKLQPLFQRFRQFMMSVYQKISALGVKVSPQIRGVFDRMLATDDEIAEAEHARSMLPLGKEHFDENSWREYQKQLNDAHQGSVAELEARSLRDMQWLTNARGREINKLQKQTKGFRDAIRQQVATEVRTEPVYRAIDYLKHGRWEGEPTEGAGKLSIEEVKAMYPDEATQGVVMNKLGFGKYGMLGSENAIHPEQAADLFGYSSGDHLIRALMEAEPFEDRVNGITEQRLLEEHGELTTEQGIKEAADRAIFSDLRARVMATELNALNKKAGRPAILAQAARSYAETQIARTRVRDLKPALFEAAAARAGRNVMDLLGKGKTTEAAAEKRNQLLNTYMAKEAIKAKEEIAQMLGYFDRMNRATGKQVDHSYLSQIHALLDRVDLKQGRTLKDIDSTTSLGQWINDQQENGFDPIITEDMAARLSQAGSYKNMSIEDLRGLRDSIKNIEALGRLKNKLLTAANDRSFAEARDQLADSLEHEAFKDRSAPLETHGAKYSLAKTARSAITSLRRFGSMVYEMDGFKEGGPAWELLKRPLDRAADKETQMLTASGEALQPLFAKLGRFKGPFGTLTDELHIPEIGQSLSLEGRIAVALNMGNEINRERVMTGYKWSPAQVDAILRSLTAEQWHFVQGVWDHIGSYWPQISAKQLRVTGVEPERVQPTPLLVRTSDGQQLELAGGYYPIKYDGDKSERAAGHEVEAIARDMMRGAYTASTTRRGHTQERVESTGMPLDLKLSVLSRHLQEVIHDLSHHEALIDVTRMLRDERVSAALRNGYGVEARDYVKKLYSDVAAGNVPAVSGWAKMLDWLRTGLISSQLGFNLFIPTLHLFNLHKATQAIGPEYMAKATAKFVADAASMRSTVNWIAAQSPFMKQRAVKGMAELAGVRDSIAGKSKVQQFAEHYGFYLIEKGQLMADVPTWLAQYMKSTDAGSSHERAVELADETVRRVQGGGRKVDTAAILRSDQSLMKLFTAYYGFTNSNFNLQAEAINRARKAYGLGGTLAAVKVSPMLLSATLAYTFAPALYHLAIHALLQGQAPDKDKMRVLPLTAVMSLFPFARDFVPLAQDLSSGGKVRGVAPAGLPYDPFVRMANDLHKGSWDWHSTADAATLAGMFSHLPLGQVVRTAHGIQALEEGKTKNPGAVIVGPPAAN